jgi:hypothetical protein
MRLRRRAVAVGSLALLAAGLWASAASATFHEISIREVYPGSVGRPESQYVELQMWAAGQNLVSGHSLTVYKASGGIAGATTFASNVPGDANQSTVLLGTPAIESEFGVAPDAVMAPGQLNPSGGAACWEAIDCVSWGSFKASLPSPAGQPAAPFGIPDGMALRRTIAPGCASLLEPTDDRDDSAADFAAVFPGPRPNSVGPSEHACGSSGPQSGGPSGSGQGAPQTRIVRGPGHRTHDRTPTFRFAADDSGASFECKLDRGSFKPCRSPFTSRRLSLGRHSFQVRARESSGELDPSPARYAFKLIARR